MARSIDYRLVKIKTATRRENSEYLHERTSCSLFCLKRERKGEREKEEARQARSIFFQGEAAW